MKKPLSSLSCSTRFRLPVSRFVFPTLLVAGGLLSAFVGCSSGTKRSEGLSTKVSKETLKVVTVDLADRKQRIRGFGASSAWTAPFMSAEMADSFFSEDRGLGLSLLRIQISPDGSNRELETAKQAYARGASVWAAPWSPPGEWKDNGMTQNGGVLLKERYSDWAARLADFAESSAAEGVPLLGISAQNEPDFTESWDTCRYEPEELADFVGEYLGPALAELDVSVPVIAPESANWGTIERFGNALLEHSSASDYILAYATHGYGNVRARDLPEFRESGRELWLTEISDPTSSTPDTGMTSALRVARIIHDDLTIGQVTAWHYWWLLPRGDQSDTNAALMDTDRKLTRRAYLLGHYSKFIRPGYVRVESTRAPARQVVSSAYVNPNEDEVVLVFASDRSGELDQKIELPGFSASSVRWWLTDKDKTLEKQEDIGIDGESFMITLPANSIITVVLNLTPVHEEAGQGGAGGDQNTSPDLSLGGWGGFN